MDIKEKSLLPLYENIYSIYYYKFNIDIDRIIFIMINSIENDIFIKNVPHFIPQQEPLAHELDYIVPEVRFIDTNFTLMKGASQKSKVSLQI